MRSSFFIFNAIILFSIVLCNHDLYCGDRSCYEVLNVSKGATFSEISRSFRRLAAANHPDVNKDPNAVSIYHTLSNAYEVLKNPKDRQNYDDYLNSPENLANIYGYYRREMYRKIDIRIVIILFLLIFSYIQFFLLDYNYESNVKIFMSKPKFKNYAYKLFNEERSANNVSKGKKNFNSSQPEIDDNFIKKVVEQSPDFYTQHTKPTWKSTLIGIIITFPIISFNYLSNLLKWHYKYSIMNKEYEAQDKIKLTCKALNVHSAIFDSLSPSDQEYYLSLRLWEPENLKEYLEELEGIERKKLAESGKAKSFRRFMKNGGFGRMSFDD